jgi:hypothetical protein
VRAKKPTQHNRARKAAAVQGPLRSPAVLVGIIALSGTVIIAAMGRAREPERSAATDVQLEAASPANEFVVAPEVAVAEPAAMKAPPIPTPESKPVAASSAETAALEASEVVAPLTHAVIASPDVAAATDAPAPPTTITGCLAFDAGAYRLKDATGTDAPKSRSWKSGFLRKRSATLEVVDAGALGLPNYVGQRVEVTGTLVEREMQARSLHRLAQSCKK